MYPQHELESTAAMLPVVSVRIHSRVDNTVLRVLLI